MTSSYETPSAHSSVEGLRYSVEGSRCSVDRPRFSVDGPRCCVDGPRDSVEGPRSNVEGPRCSSSDLSLVERSVSAPLVVLDSPEMASAPSPPPCDPRPLQELYFNNRQRDGFAEREQQTCDTTAELQSAEECPCANLECIDKELKVFEHKDVKKESGCPSSACGSSCEGCRHKLLATMQVLANKEETVRVQAQSLQLAEGRLAALAARAAQLRAELRLKDQQLRALQKGAEKADASITAEIQDVENQKLVKTLQSNLSVIEELYRECFYETAKQEDLIEMLRKSYQEVRTRDREKSAQIHRMQSVIDAQKGSLERCQDIAMEVDNLKVEISNFLNSSNNDSGVWEEPVPELAAELHGISAQLLQLRDLLTGDCTCGLEEENVRLKRANETMEIQMGELRQRISDLEGALLDKESTEEHYMKEIERREREFTSIRQQLMELKESSRDQNTTCDTLSRQLKQAQVLLEDKSTELLEVQQRCQTQQATIQEVRAELDRANQIIKENSAIRCEVRQLRALVAAWRDQLAAAELHASDRRRELHACYREQAQQRRRLQAQLAAAAARGAQLLEEARRVVTAARHWLHGMRRACREKEEKIKEQQAIINTLQKKLGDRQSKRNFDESERSFKYMSCGPSVRSGCTSEKASCSRARQHERTSESEIASCSSAPVPPRRQCRNKISTLEGENCR